MNIEQANTIAIAQILSTYGLKPVRTVKDQSWYLSPLRKERTASFHVHNIRNVWFDHGIGIGGKAIDLVRKVLESRKESHSVKDALRIMSAMSGSSAFLKPVASLSQAKTQPTLILKSIKPIRHMALIRYLESRGIVLSVANKTLKEVRVNNTETGQNIFALGLSNEDGGYEVRNPTFKACIAPKSISFIRGREIKPEGVHIFEGFMDYLSIVTSRNGKVFDNDTIILNSLSCLSKASPYIKGYGYKTVYSWMDNDDAGRRAVSIIDDFIRTEPELNHYLQNHIYAPFKDVNAWHMQKLGL